MRHLRVLVSVLSGIVLALVAAVPAAAGTVSAATPGGGTNGFEQCAPPGGATNGLYSSNRSESTIAVDPTSPDHLLGLSKFFFSSSYGKQQTDWSEVYRFHLGSYEIGGPGSGNQILPGYDCATAPALGLIGWDATTDPNVAFDHRGNAYSDVLGINYNNSQNGIFVSKKPAGSPTWNAPVPVKQYVGQRGLGREYDKQWIAADWNPASPFAGNVYVAFSIFSPFNTVSIYFSRSTDGGRTFSNPTQLSNQSGNVNTYVYLDVDSTGTLYVEYTNFRGSVSGVANVLASTDGGKSFSKPLVGPAFTAEPPAPRTNGAWTLPNTSFRDGIIDYFAVSHKYPGHLWIAAEQWDLNGQPTSDPTGDYDVAVYSSPDGGRSWSGPSLANDAFGDGADHFQPSIAADASGNVAVAWYDRHNSCPTTQPAPGYYTSPGTSNYCIQTALQWYDDATGAKHPSANVFLSPIWDPQQPSTGATQVGGYAPGFETALPHSVFNPCFSNGVNVCVTFIGDYFGLAVSNGNAYVLAVSTYPSDQYPSGVAAWSRAVAGSITPGAITPAANGYYQQQVLYTARAG